ncbi:hypothetical protein [Qipengyuania marisflavi]|uniref:Uncharacterized protein n=1 Tax=Qipengyuania marisflavi TaxID=2486356 RepID=A0A5S3P603_9SPHN|nr:hypothetical protein [Qipengyuania marisflavi]TMM48366.1 hypothetical protein FEV51_08800 [Qipengyuania marisflavi]
MKFRFAALTAATLALAACGSTDDASTEAEADTVEITADEALADVTETPVADADATAAAATAGEGDTAPAAPSVSEQQRIESAGDNAAATAEAAMEALAEDETN